MPQYPLCRCQRQSGAPPSRRPGIPLRSEVIVNTRPRRALRDTRLVIFDCDGVLVDTERIGPAVVAEMAAEVGWPLRSCCLSGLEDDVFAGRA
ncbi:hypothetical protein CGL27_00935 [Streptomyces sp. 11-1-2]|nr:hypothetical protein CGL27_00935 [Streptomyces sp. 11-1-2]